MIGNSMTQNGATKFTWIHGLDGHGKIKGLRGAAGGIGLFSWYSLNPFIISLMPKTNFGQQMTAWANDFILDDSCKSCCLP